MAQIRPKQIKLNNATRQGDLIISNASGNGIVLQVGNANDVLRSNGTTAVWGTLNASSLNLLEGNVFVGNASNLASAVAPTAQGQVVVSNVSNHFVSDFVAAQYVTFAANSTNNIASTNVQSAIVEVAAERPYVHTSTLNPTVQNDSSDSASLGETFKVGDVWVNTVTDNVFTCVDSSANTAVWLRSTGFAGVFTYKGDTDASNSGTIPTNPQPGDWWRIGTTGGTQNFNTTWDAAGEPNGATFNVGDAIIYGSDGNWHKVDNTDPVVSGGAGISSTGSPTGYALAAKVDGVTIRATGGAGDQLAAFGGLSNQVLTGAGASNDAVWAYVSDLRDTNGNLIIDGQQVASAVNYFTVSNSSAGNGVTIGTFGADTNIDLILDPAGTGQIILDGTAWPTNIPQYSILATNNPNELSPVTSPNGSGDQILIFDDTLNTIVWAPRTTVGGLAFGTVVTDSGTLIADSTSDTLTILGGEGISTVGAPLSDTLTIDLNIPELTLETTIDLANDVMVFYDVSAGAHRKASIGSVGNYSFKTVAGDSGTAIADSTADSITFIGGEAITTVASDNPETLTINLNIPELTLETTLDLANDVIVFYDQSAGVHRKATLGSVGNYSFKTVNGDSGSAVADSTADSITFVGGEGISTIAADDPETLTINLNIPELTLESNIDLSNDVIVFYDQSAGVHRKATIGSVGNYSFKTVTGDSGTATADSTADSLAIVGGSAISTVATDGPEVLTVNLDTLELSVEPNLDRANDYIIFWDQSAAAHKRINIGAVGEYGFKTVSGDSGTSAVADSTADTLIIEGGEGLASVGDGINDKITINLDLNSLTAETTVDSANDYFVFYDASTSSHKKITADNLSSTLGGTPAQDEEVALGGVNESFTGFFTNTPVSDATITIYFNGVKLRETGWSRSGNNLTLVDAINGYATESGDIIAASYEY